MDTIKKLIFFVILFSLVVNDLEAEELPKPAGNLGPVVMVEAAIDFAVWTFTGVTPLNRKVKVVCTEQLEDGRKKVVDCKGQGKGK